MDLGRTIVREILDVVHRERVHVVALLIVILGACVAVVPARASIDVPLYVELNGHGSYVLNPPPVYEDYYFWGDTVEITITGDDVSNSSSTRYLYDGVVGEGSGSYTGGAMVFHVTMNEEIFEDVHWRVQYLVVFDASGLTGDTGLNTVVTVGGSSKVQADLPFAAWYDFGAVAAFTYTATVAGAYDLSGITASMLDASGHLVLIGVTTTHTVIGPFTTILGAYIPHPTTTTSTETSYYGGGATTTTTSGTATVLGWAPPSGSLEFPDIFSGLRDWWGTITSGWRSTSTGGFESTGSFGAWFNGSTYEIPNYIILFGCLFFILILFSRRSKKKNRER